MITPQFLRLAAANWRMVHEAVHGPLDVQTAETVNEAIGFLITCAQVEECNAPTCVPGAPYSGEFDLKPDEPSEFTITG